MKKTEIPNENQDNYTKLFTKKQELSPTGKKQRQLQRRLAVALAAFFRNHSMDASIHRQLQRRLAVALTTFFRYHSMDAPIHRQLQRRLAVALATFFRNHINGCLHPSSVATAPRRCPGGVLSQPFNGCIHRCP